MKAITLDDVIEKNLKDPEFKKLYEKEQLIKNCSILNSSHKPSYKPQAVKPK
jgi:hypothetical protein